MFYLQAFLVCENMQWTPDKRNLLKQECRINEQWYEFWLAAHRHNVSKLGLNGTHLSMISGKTELPATSSTYGKGKSRTNMSNGNAINNE